MRLTIRAALLAATALLSLPAMAEDAKPAKANAAAKAAESAPVKDYTILKVNGEDIKNSEVVDAWKGLFPTGSAPDFNAFDENIRQNVLRGIVSEKLIYKEAVAAGADKNPDVQKRIANMQKQIVMQAFMEQKAKSLVTDDQAKTEYDKRLAATKGQDELKARHILVASEEEAKKIAEQIKKGGDFEKIAKEKSVDKGSSAKGGELGWFTKDKMVPEFANAADKLKKGEVSAPVKTDFGWHIIRLEDRRPVQLATFDDMKDSIKAELANKAVDAYVEGLVKKADVKYYAADGKEKPLTATVEPAAGEDKKTEKK